MKKLLIGLGVVVVLVVAALVVVPMLIPLDSYKGEIEARVKDATGRDLRIDGGISLSLLPSIAVSVENVSFANAAGASTPQMATVKRLDVALQVLPLLRGEVAVDRFVLDHPVINLEVDEKGKPNWQFGTTAAKAPAAGGGSSGATGGGGGASTSGGSALSELHLGDVRLIDGTLNYLDKQTGQKQQVSKMNMELSLPSLSQPFDATGSAEWNGEMVSLDVKAQNPRALMNGETSKLAMKVDAKPVVFSFDGAARNAGAVGLQGKLSLDVPSIRKLAAWAGKPLDVPGNGLGPFSLKGQLEMMGPKVALTDATIKLDDINGKGLFSVDASGAKPMVKAELAVDDLNVNPYLPPEQKTSAGGGSAGGASGGAAKGGGTNDWSDAPIDVSPLGLLNADLTFKAGAIQFRKLKIGKIDLKVVLKDSKLTADLSEMQLYDGIGKGKITVDASGAKPTLGADFDLANFQAGPFLSDLANFDRLLGTTETKLSVTSTGDSQRQLVSNLNGNGSVVFRDGAIKGINLAAMVRNISTAAIEKSFNDAEATDFAELSGTFKIDKGVVSNDDLSLTAPLVRMTGAGKIPLPPRTIDYEVKPKLVASIEGQGGANKLAGIEIPIKVTGPWTDISYKPDLGAALKGQMKNPEAVIKKLEDGGAKDLLKNLKPDSSSGGDSKSNLPLDLKKGLFGN